MNWLIYLAATVGSNCNIPNKTFFFLPPWWEYLPGGTVDSLGQCSINFRFPQDIWPIGLWGLDVLIRIAGFVAVIGVIIAGVTYLTTTGNSDKAGSARKRLYNSLIGLIIALIATAFVSFIGRSLKG